jgi:hypothetical protein
VSNYRPAPPSSRLQGLLWLGAAAAAGIALAVLYPDSYQQDGGTHYLFARWAWRHPTNFVDVWGRPLFTFLYAFPALFGYTAAKLFSVAICVATAWQSWRLAEQLSFERAELAIPFLFLQPSYLLLCADTMTEPLFALVFVVALRLHLAGRLIWGMLAASLLILVRPEGFFLGVLWGVWVLLDRRDGRAWWRRIPSPLLLASGAVAWWLAALLISGDPLWIKRNWPPDWQVTGAVYGSGPIWWYASLLSVIVGLLLIVPFAVGLIQLLKERRFATGVSAFLALFLLHSLMYTRGLWGAAGYPRYLVCVAPAMALITLAGWNVIAGRLSQLSRSLATAAWVVLLALSGLFALFYVDAWGYARDARAVTEMYRWFRAHERPVTRLIWSQVYMCILFDRNPWERPTFSGDHERNLALLRESPTGTLIFWDGDTGPGWFGLRPDDFKAAGYTHLRSQSYQLDGLFFQRSWRGYGGTRKQEMHLFYKD